MIDFKNILYPIDLDSENISSLISALEIANYFNAHIHILYVNDSQAGYRHPTDREDTVAIKVREIAPAHLLEKVNITYAASKGELADEVAIYCKNYNIDLVITGHKRRNKLYYALFDSADENIIETIDLPVLVIPEK